jgi:CDP-diacylglycerol--glycerol-3-phosphate 3-phosphatidyltransferase|tara:strand:+ start:62 stop:679 length:618 start_codon:yes stop_codon:yes gene_type:complete
MRPKFSFKRRKKIRKKRLVTRHDRIMTLANSISISRILLTFPLVYILNIFSIETQEMAYVVWGIILLIVFTDFLDGYVARKTDEITNFGKIIDPVADKICLVVVLTFLIFEYKLPFLIFFLLLSIRDVYLIIIGVYLINAQEEVFQSNWTGKWFLGISTLMMAAFIFPAPEWARWGLYSISLLLMAVSTWQYSNRYHKYFKQIER